MSDYQDYSWGVTLLDTETESPGPPGLADMIDPDQAGLQNSTFDVRVCGNLTDDYKMVRSCLKLFYFELLH